MTLGAIVGIIIIVSVVTISVVFGFFIGRRKNTNNSKKRTYIYVDKE
jgi:uncharacterized protein YneF (UPF0154 family)